MKSTTKPGNSTRKPAAGPSKPEIAKPAARPEEAAHARHRELTESQQRTCDLCADLIMNGGVERDVKNLIRAALGHHWMRRIGSSYNPEYAPIYAEKWTPERYRELARYWPERRAAGPARPAPATVVEMATNQARLNLEHRFKDFMAQASMEDVYFLHAVLENAAAGQPMPEAFVFEFDAHDTWVKVPLRYVKRIKDVVSLLADDTNETA